MGRERADIQLGVSSLHAERLSLLLSSKWRRIRLRMVKPPFSVRGACTGEAGSRSLTHHLDEVGVRLKIVLQSVDDQVLLAVRLAENQHVQYALQMETGREIRDNNGVLRATSAPSDLKFYASGAAGVTDLSPACLLTFPKFSLQQARL